MVVTGCSADYDEWGEEWSFAVLRPYLERARRALRTSPSNTDRPQPFHAAFLRAAQETGLPKLDDLDDPNEAVGVAAFPANVADGRRWNAAFAYLDPARDRPNLSIEADTLVDRVEFAGRRATTVLAADGRRFEGDNVFLTAGAYFSAAILLRSGVGPEAELALHQIPVVQALPVGERLLDHCGTDVAFELEPTHEREVAAQAEREGVFEGHTAAKVASTRCDRCWDLHLVPWIYPAEPGGGFRASIIVFHMKPLSFGRVRLRSRDAAELPVVERGYFREKDDIFPLLEGIELARSIASTSPLRDWFATELSPGGADAERYLHETIRNYFHQAGTCAIGTVVDSRGAVHGLERLFVADASVMPSIPRANTNLTTAAIAERIAELT